MESSGLELSDILSCFLRRKWVIITTAAAAALLGLFYGLLATPIYTASILLKPQDQGNANQLAGITGRLSGFASLAGINLGQSGDEAYLAILNSRNLALRFVKQNDLAPSIFPDLWDAEQQSWLPVPDGFIPSTIDAIKGFFAWIAGNESPGERPATVEPTDQQIYEAFREIRQISQDDITGLVTVRFLFRDPILATRWADDYVALANETIRTLAVEEARRSLEFLNQEMEDVRVISVQQTAARLIEGQLERIMLANSRKDYAFAVIDPALKPEEPSFPNPTLLFLVAGILGGTAGLFGALLLDIRAGRLGRSGMASSSNQSSAA